VIHPHHDISHSEVLVFPSGYVSGIDCELCRRPDRNGFEGAERDCTCLGFRLVRAPCVGWVGVLIRTNAVSFHRKTGSIRVAYGVTIGRARRCAGYCAPAGGQTGNSIGRCSLQRQLNPLLKSFETPTDAWVKRVHDRSITGYSCTLSRR